MPSLDSTSQQAANLYWLAFLLTGNRQAGADAATESLESSPANPFFLTWMLAWSRKVVIAKALAAIRQELAASAERVAAVRSPRSAAYLPANWTLPGSASKMELERALLAIDAFPRCVLLLLLFEGLSMEDATVLLDADRELIRKAQVFAIQELTRNLAGARETSRA
jgi:DNA-directed RNA polymerase specialized sigma24 family protein